MSLPISLKKAIEQVSQGCSYQEIANAREQLTGSYRYRQAAEQKKFISNHADRIAYLTARLPATYAVVFHVLEELKHRVSALQIKSMLDLGSGPGTALWAASAAFENIEKLTALEKDAELITLGKKLSLFSTVPTLQKADWQCKDFSREANFYPHDLLIFSYSIGEIPPQEMAQVVKSSWQAAGQYLIFIEPGTPAGFTRIREIRQQLIDLGAYLIAPCPHQNACPMAQNDWCHFSQRLERSTTHRRAKQGTLGYEDEKFSYLIVSKNFGGSHPPSRILRHPEKHSGHIALTLCTSEGLQKKIISKRQGELYKKARKASWGDVF